MLASLVGSKIFNVHPCRLTVFHLETERCLEEFTVCAQLTEWKRPRTVGNEMLVLFPAIFFKCPIKCISMWNHDSYSDQNKGLSPSFLYVFKELDHEGDEKWKL